jgi:hypothetical protein
VKPLLPRASRRLPRQLVDNRPCRRPLSGSFDRSRTFLCFAICAHPAQIRGTGASLGNCSCVALGFGSCFALPSPSLDSYLLHSCSRAQKCCLLHSGASFCRSEPCSRQATSNVFASLKPVTEVTHLKAAQRTIEVAAQGHHLETFPHHPGQGQLFGFGAERQAVILGGWHLT